MLTRLLQIKTKIKFSLQCNNFDYYIMCSLCYFTFCSFSCQKNVIISLVIQQIILVDNRFYSCLRYKNIIVTFNLWKINFKFVLLWCLKYPANLSFCKIRHVECFKIASCTSLKLSKTNRIFFLSHFLQRDFIMFCRYVDLLFPLWPSSRMSYHSSPGLGSNSSSLEMDKVRAKNCFKKIMFSSKTKHGA